MCQGQGSFPPLASRLHNAGVLTNPKPVYSTRVQRTSLQYRNKQEMYRKGITLTDNKSDRNVQGTEFTHVTTFLIHYSLVDIQKVNGEFEHGLRHHRL